MTSELISTRDKPGAYDAFETAKPGEIVFTVQGLDPFGPDTVQFWADRAREAGLAECNAERSHHLLRKASAAEIVAWEMRAQQKGEAEQEGVRAQYNDAPQAIEEVTVRSILIRLAQRLNNAAGDINELYELLEKHQGDSLTGARLWETVCALKDMAEYCEPRRGNERT